ncbi:MAG: ferrochelatase [Rhizobiales bacterium]|nr:ferrochelatase [Hyphomicrobiales bacterium]
MKKTFSAKHIAENLKKPVLNSDHAGVKQSKVGLLLVNLGTPDGYDKKSMRRYLQEFLTDVRVVEWSKVYWYPILYGIVLNTRPKKSGELYKSIWNNELDESPLRTITRAQSEKLAKVFKNEKNLEVDWGMRYGNPSIKSRISVLREKGCQRIVVFPLYPQYSATTTASVSDKTFLALKELRWMPAIRMAPAYHDEPVYIEALAVSIEKHLATLDFIPEKIIASYHGIPKKNFKKGDPYPCQCRKTTRLLRERLGMSEDQLLTCFQSRFGRDEWVQPYTDATLETMAKEGVKNVAVINPGFVADCLETLEEIAFEAAESFHENGGENFTYIPCLNDSDEGIAVLESIARRELSGWV